MPALNHISEHRCSLTAIWSLLVAGTGEDIRAPEPRAAIRKCRCTTAHRPSQSACQSRSSRFSAAVCAVLCEQAFIFSPQTLSFRCTSDRFRHLSVLPEGQGASRTPAVTPLGAPGSSDRALPWPLSSGSRTPHYCWGGEHSYEADNQRDRRLRGGPRATGQPSGSAHARTGPVQLGAAVGTWPFMSDPDPRYRATLAAHRDPGSQP